MANRVTPLTQIELLSGNISAQTYFDNNIGPAFSALNDASLGYVNGVLADSGSANNYIVSCLFGIPSAYNQGMTVVMKPANSNTGASTITVSPLASVSILRPDGTACVGGEIVANIDVTMVFNGTAFVIAALPWVPVVSSLGSIATNQTVPCKNASSVSVVFLVSAVNLTITLQNLAIGVPVSIMCTGNSSGGATFFAINATNPAGSAYTPFYVQQGVVGAQASFAIAANKALGASGAANGGSLYLIGVESA